MKKIICLHGYAMTSAWLQSWLDQIQHQLGDDYQLLYPQGPIACPAEEVRAMIARFNIPLPETRIGKGKNWCWYRADETQPPRYRQIEETLAYLTEYFAQHGTIDGVIGWSQGAAMTAILAALRQQSQERNFRFNWAILCGGFLPGDSRYQPLFERPLNLPTLHVVGKKEPALMKTQAHKLQTAFLNAERLDTPCDHIMPVKFPAEMEKISHWIKCRD